MTLIPVPSPQKGEGRNSSGRPPLHCGLQKPRGSPRGCGHKFHVERTTGRGCGVLGQDTARTKVRATGTYRFGHRRWIVVQVTCQRELKFALRGVGVPGQETGTNRGETGTNRRRPARTKRRLARTKVRATGTYRFGHRRMDCCACDLSTRTKVRATWGCVLGQETGTNRRETGTNKEETGTSRGRPARTEVRATGRTDWGQTDCCACDLSTRTKVRATWGWRARSGDRHEQRGDWHEQRGDQHKQRCGQPDEQFRAQMNDCCACDLSTRTLVRATWGWRARSGDRHEQRGPARAKDASGTNGGETARTKGDWHEAGGAGI